MYLLPNAGVSRPVEAWREAELTFVEACQEMVGELVKSGGFPLDLTKAVWARLPSWDNEEALGMGDDTSKPDELGLVTTSEAARLLGLSKQQLNQWRSKGLGPEYIKLCRAVRYQRRDLLRWIEAKRCVPAPKRGPLSNSGSP